MFTILICSIVLTICALLCAVFVFLLRKLALRRSGAVAGEMPLVGGIAIGISLLVYCVLTLIFSSFLILPLSGILIAAFTMLIFGLIDDRFELSVAAKLFLQIIASILLILGGVRTQMVCLSGMGNLVITMAWILVITNAFNLLDVMDGVAMGVTVIISLSFFAISILNADIVTAAFCLVLAGTTLGCLIYNFPPAKVYLGNSGSHFLGFILAGVALKISYAPMNRKIALFTPLLILGFPIFDTLFLIFMRIKKGRSVFKKSKDHLVLRLLKLGHSKSRALVYILLLTLFFALSGVLVSQVSNFWGIVIITLAMLITIGLTRKAAKVVVDA